MLALHIVCWVLSSLFALLLLLRLIPAGLDSKRPLTELIALSPYAAAAELLVTVVAYGSGDWGCGILGSLFVLWEVWFLRSYFFGKRKKAPEKLLTVMTLNCRYGRADAGAIESFAEKEGVDVLALQEVSCGLREKAALFPRFPYQVSGEESGEDNGGFNMVLSRIPPSESLRSTVDIAAARCPAMKFDFDGGTLLVASVHPKSPHRGGDFWGWGVNHLASFISYTTGKSVKMPKMCPVLPIAEPPVRREADFAVVMGDMNSSVDLPSFRAVLKRGMKDSSMEVHTGLHPTFPATWKGWHEALELDHVLHSPGIRSYRVKTKKIPGTDHLALVSCLGKEEE
ncbi:MAG: endonuclease/exonuclease/phosphatase family protein [Aeriscardovia sp.]|nr:endonuclease/exonuclease/phosphatase family protein [Aeriscardovia sp.]